MAEITNSWLRIPFCMEDEARIETEKSCKHHAQKEDLNKLERNK